MNTYPRQVRLRNGHSARVDGLVKLGPEGAEQAFLQGSHTGAAVELWKGCGRWSYRDADHPLDIVTMFTPGGEAVAINNAEASA